MAAPVISTDALVAEVSRSQGLSASVVAFINGVAALIQTAVDAAIAADDAADEGTAQAVRDAIAGVVSSLTSSNDAIAQALAANPGPVTAQKH